MVADSLQKAAYLSTFIEEKDVPKGKNNRVIVSKIDTQTSIKVALTALVALSLGIVLFMKFRKE